MKEPLIAILMATYNGEKFVSEQINSILNQTYKNWKLIIHDDCSTDLTVNIIKDYVYKYPDKIILIEDEVKCGGAKENFFHLIKIVKEKWNFNYIMFADQDDVWLPEKIKITFIKMLEVEKKYGKKMPILVHTDLKIVDENLNLLCDSFWKYQNLDPRIKKFNYLLVQNNVTGSTMMINNSLFQKIKYIPKNAIMHDWWIALIASSFGKIKYINEPTLLYRQHSYNDTGASEWNLKYILNKVKRLDGTVLSLKKAIKQAEEFAKLYYPELPQEYKNLLDVFISLPKVNFTKKIGWLIKYKFFRKGILRNLGLLLAIRNIKE